MYRGKRKSRKPVILLASLAALLLTVGGTLAYLMDAAGPVTNTFEPSHVHCDVVESFDGTVKSNVQIKNNNSDCDVYIRARIIVNWKDKNGNICGTAPVRNRDYVMTVLEGDWFPMNGGWVYKYPVAPNETTGVLIQSVTRTGTEAPEGYELSVDIIAEAIQSTPARAVTESWGVSVDANGVLAP